MTPYLRLVISYHFILDSCQQFLESVLGYLESTVDSLSLNYSRGCLALIRGRVARVDKKSMFDYGGDFFA